MGDSAPQSPAPSPQRYFFIYTAAMKTLRNLIIIAALLMLCACGNKGDLVRPEPKSLHG
jgi:hypothetical protein